MRHRLVETITRFTPLGVRFWDPAVGRPVRGGLRVTAWPLGAGGAGTRAFRTASGAYALQGLPGLDAVEWAEAPTSGPEVLGLQRRFAVAVEDPEGRFVPVAFAVDLPREERGLYPPAGAGSLDDTPVPGFSLFSAPSRTVPSAAAVRAQLVDATTDGPAARAVLEVDVDGETWVGLADGAGAAAVLFPVPRFQHTLTGSFPEGGTPLYDYAWPLTVRVRYAPEAVETAPETAGLAGGPLPLLTSLFDQPAGQLYAVAPGSLDAVSPADILADALVYGRETTLRSRNASVLYVEPAPSLP